MNKLLSYLKKHIMGTFIVGGMMMAVAVLAFLRSDARMLIFRPVKPVIKQKSSLPAGRILGSAKKTITRESLLKLIREKYGYIHFVSVETVYEYNDKGDIASRSRRVKTSVPVPPSIRGIAGLDSGYSYIDRMKAADALGSILTPAEQNALLHFLHKKAGDDALKPLKLNAVKNQVVIALMRQIPVNKELPLHLIAMYYEKDFMDLTWRDYCIQFLGQCYHQIESTQYKSLVRDTLFKALEENKNIAAPAIIALDGLSKHPGFVKSVIAHEAYKLLTDSKTSHIVKIPALQIAAKYNHPQTLQLATDLLKPQLSRSKNGSHRLAVPVILKMSAIAAIGARGRQAEKTILKTYQNSTDIRLRTAAKVALNKISKRIWDRGQSNEQIF